MRLTRSYLYLIVLTFSQLIDGARKPESVLLSKVKTLTLRKDLMTSSNRVAAVPQVFPILSHSCWRNNFVGFIYLLNSLAEMYRRKRQGSLRCRHNAMQEPGLWLWQWKCSMDLFCVSSYRIQAWLHRCHMWRLRLVARSLRSQRKLRCRVQAPSDCRWWGKVWP